MRDYLKKESRKEVINMGNNAILDQQEALEVNTDNILKMTALLYVKEALAQEEYEACPELLGLARKFGAQPNEINKLLAGAVAKSQKKRNGANNRF